MSFFKRFFGSTRHNDPVAWELYEAVVQQARAPAFYRNFGVPDTLDGRFDLIVLHMFLILHRIKDSTADQSTLGQNLFDAMVSDLDRSLREMGAGDLGVAPRVKKMVKAFYGRVSAYQAGLAARDPAVLDDALRRNLFGTVAAPLPEAIKAVHAYMRREVEGLNAQDIDDIRQGRIAFGAPPLAGTGADDSGA